LIPIVTGAGGVVTNWEGKPAQSGGRIVAAGDPRVHEGHAETSQQLVDTTAQGPMDALIVVDMQVGLLAGEPKHDLHGVIGRINRLAAKVRERSGRVIFVQHCGGKGDDFEPENAGLGAASRTAPRPCRCRGSEDPERSFLPGPNSPSACKRSRRTGSSSRDGRRIFASMRLCGPLFQTTTMSSWSRTPTP
jgi:hypothetical protein